MAAHPNTFPKKQIPSNSNHSLYTALLIGSLTASLSAATFLQDYDPIKHSRYVNNDAFIGNDYEFSGVGLESGGYTRWATMISDTYFVSCTHAPPTVGNDIIFHVDNNAAGGTESIEVMSITRIGTTDLVVGRLASAPTIAIARYGITGSVAVADFSLSDYNGLKVFTVGRNTGISTTSFRLGRNILTALESWTEGTSTGDTIYYNDDRNKPTSLGADESYLQGGDSGAPLFVKADGQLGLIGSNWTIDGLRSGSTFIPNYADEISSIVEAGGESITIIPEPSFTTLMTLAISYAPDAVPNPTVTLTWSKTEAASYIAKYSPDMSDWGNSLGVGIGTENDENPGDPDHITLTFPLTGGLENATKMFFRVEEE